jgi:hypothetical protein
VKAAQDSDSDTDTDSADILESMAQAAADLIMLSSTIQAALWIIAGLSSARIINTYTQHDTATQATAAAAYAIARKALMIALYHGKRGKATAAQIQAAAAYESAQAAAQAAQESGDIKAIQATQAALESMAAALQAAQRTDNKASGYNRLQSILDSIQRAAIMLYSGGTMAQDSAITDSADIIQTAAAALSIQQGDSARAAFRACHKMIYAYKSTDSRAAQAQAAQDNDTDSAAIIADRHSAQATQDEIIAAHGDSFTLQDIQDMTDSGLLTDTQAAILRALADGYNQKQAAALLELSTVKTYRAIKAARAAILVYMTGGTDTASAAALQSLTVQAAQAAHDKAIQRAALLTQRAATQAACIA